MSQKTIDIEALTGLNAQNPEEFKAILSRLSYFGAKGTKEFLNELLEHVILHTLSRMERGMHTGSEIFKTIKKYIIELPLDLDTFLEALRHLTINGEIKCATPESDVYETEIKYYLEPKTKAELVHSYTGQVAFEKKIIEDWLSGVKNRNKDLSPSDLEALLSDLEAFSYRLYSQHSIESVSLLLGDRADYKHLLSKMDTNSLVDILPERSLQLKNIRRHELPNFFQDADDHRKLYISQKLNSMFMLHILKLQRKDAEELKKLVSGGTLYLDTNFLYRLFGLDGMELQAAAVRLKELSEKLGYTMVVSQRTLEEYKSSIQAHIQQARKMPTISPELAKVALDVSFGNDFYREYFRLSKDAYGISYEGALKFYSKVEFLLQKYNVKVDSEGDTFIRSNWEAVSTEEGYLRNYAPGKYFKNDDVVNHDAFMRLLILHRRQGQEQESYLETRYWLLTLDTGLVQYDRRIRPKDNLRIPYCMLCSQLMQLLRPFSALLEDEASNAFQIAQASALDSPLFRLFKLPETATILDIITRMKLIDGLPADAIMYAVADEAFVQAFAETKDDAKREELIQQLVQGQVFAKMTEEKKELEEKLQGFSQENEKVKSELLAKISQIENYQIKEEEHQKKEAEAELAKQALNDELKKVMARQEMLEKKIQDILSQNSSSEEQNSQLSNLVEELKTQKHQQQIDITNLQTSYKTVLQDRDAIISKYRLMVAESQAKSSRQIRTNLIILILITVAGLELSLWSWHLSKPLSWLHVSVLLLGVVAVELVVFYRRRFSLPVKTLLISIGILTVAISILLPIGMSVSDVYGYLAAGIQTFVALYTLLIYIKEKDGELGKAENQTIPFDNPASRPEEQHVTIGEGTSTNRTESQRWLELGDNARESDEFEIAKQAYQRAGEVGRAKLNEVILLAKQKEIETILQSMQAAKQKKEWRKVISTCQSLLELEPGNKAWETELQNAKMELQLANKYEMATKHVRAGDHSRAVKKFEEIIKMQPNYRDAKFQLERTKKTIQGKVPLYPVKPALPVKAISYGLGVLIVVVIVFVALQPTLPRNAVEHIVFHDDFASTQHGWKVGSNSDEMGSDTSEIRDGVLRIEATAIKPTFRSLAVPKLNIKNFVLDVDVRLLNSNSGSPLIQKTPTPYESFNTSPLSLSTPSSSNNVSPIGVSFIFRGQVDEYYQLRYQTDGNCFLFYFDGTEFHQLTLNSTAQFFLLPNAENHLSLKIHDSEIIAYANGKEVLNVINNTISHSGWIKLGPDLWIEDSEAELEFDNLVIKTITR
jgi:hypothetical protein